MDPKVSPSETEVRLRLGPSQRVVLLEALAELLKDKDLDWTKKHEAGQLAQGLMYPHKGRRRYWALPDSKDVKKWLQDFEKTGKVPEP